MSLTNSDEWQIGRRGELLLFNHLLRLGFTALDVSASGGSRGAPLYKERSGNLIAADAFMVRNHHLLVEFKTKRTFFDWRGGSEELKRSSQRLMPPGPAHGISMHAYTAYCEAERKLKLPVTLWFLCVGSGEVHANSLKRLGEPFPSVQFVRGDPMVNWPLSRMIPTWRYDPMRLARYFYEPNGDVKKAPEAPPSFDDADKWIKYLRPQQLEFEDFLEDLIGHLESDWAA